MNWETFKKMPVSKKIQWVIHYYGLAIAAAIVTIFVATALLQRIFGSHEECLVKVMILDDRCSDDERLAIGAELSEYMGGICEVTSYLLSDEDQFRAFVVRLSGDELDFVIAPEEQIRELENNGYFISVDKINEEGYYYLLTDKDQHYPNKDIYIGETSVRDTSMDVLNQVKQYFMNTRK